MKVIHITRPGQKPLPLQPKTIALLRRYNQKPSLARWESARASARGANNKQLISAAAILPKSTCKSEEYAFARKMKLILEIDRQGWVHYRRKSLWHPQPYHFLFVGSKDKQREEWMMLEGACERSGPIRVPTLEAAHALASRCERLLLEVVHPRADSSTDNTDPRRDMCNIYESCPSRGSKGKKPRTVRHAS